MILMCDVSIVHIFLEKYMQSSNNQTMFDFVIAMFAEFGKIGIWGETVRG